MDGLQANQNRGDMACSRTFLIRTVKDTLHNSRARLLTQQVTAPFGYHAARALSSELTAFRKVHSVPAQSLTNHQKLVWCGLLGLWGSAMTVAYKLGQHQTPLFCGPFPTALRLSEQVDTN